MSEKDHIVPVVQSVSSNDSTDTFSERHSKGDQEYQSSSGVWDATYLHPRAIAGVLALGLTIACMFGSLIVLIVADGQPVDSEMWKIQPTVYLAIASAVGTSAVRLAKAEAASVAWWHQALQGSTVRRSEYMWRNGRSLLSAVTKIVHAPAMSVASILTWLVVIDGVLLQRASSVRSSTQTGNVDLAFSIAPEVPKGFSAIVTSAGVYTPPMALEVFYDWVQDLPIQMPIQGCGSDSTCRANVTAPGLAQTECQEQIWEITDTMWHSPNATWGPFHYSMAQNTGIIAGPNATDQVNSLFLVETGPKLVDTPPQGPEQIYIETGFTKLLPGNGSYTLRKCYFRSAILQYEVGFQDSQVILPSNMTAGRVLALANNTIELSKTEANTTQHMALMGFASQLTTFVNANATAEYIIPGGKEWELAYATLTSNSAKYLDWNPYSPEGFSPYIFCDPMQDIVAKLNTLLFRAGVVSAGLPAAQTEGKLDPGLNMGQQVVGTQFWTGNVFHTNFNWFAGAAIIDIIAVIAILPLFWGFWRLPRHLGQSPYQMAVAFNSPFFQELNSSSPVDAVLKSHGDVKIAYGLTSGPNRSYGEERLGIAEADHVIKPRKGAEIVN